MNFEDFILSPKEIPHDNWQFGSLMVPEIPENGIVLLWVSDYRGAGRDAEMLDFSSIRRKLYRLSALDFEVPVCDLGDLVSGKTPEDSHYALQEVLAACHKKGVVPVIIGGGDDFSFSLFSALNFYSQNIIYTKISNTVSLSNEGERLTEQNFLSRILSSKSFSVKNFSLLGYQKHQNDPESISLIKNVDFEVLRLAEMMNGTAAAEPFFRFADLVTVNCNAIESFAEPLSIRPEVNGLNRREICAYMKEAGMSENLKSIGIFNFDFEGSTALNEQLLAQMIWYLVEGINIRRTHPQTKDFETFWVLLDDRQYAFQREKFTGLWYFSLEEGGEKLPCAQQDYEAAKKGIVNPRLLKNLQP